MKNKYIKPLLFQKEIESGDKMTASTMINSKDKERENSYEDIFNSIFWN